MNDPVGGAWPSLAALWKHALSASEELHGHAVASTRGCWGGV
jgi:hypothetical protein